jgi:anti-sigma factor RsiW
VTHPSELISAYLDGELSREEARRLTVHMASCGRCAVEMEETQQVRAAIRSLPILDLPAGLVPEADAEVVPLHRHRGVWVGAAAAVVAAVIAIAALLAPPPGSSLTVEDLSSRFGARVSLDPVFGPAKVVTLDYEPQLVDE